jgi:transposase-like protein
MRQRDYSAEQWSTWIDQQRGSGLTIATFCGSIGVSENSLYVWWRKLDVRRGVTSSSKTLPSKGFVPTPIVESRGSN